jgi:hypothetical protein
MLEAHQILRISLKGILRHLHLHLHHPLTLDSPSTGRKVAAYCFHIQKDGRLSSHHMLVAMPLPHPPLHQLFGRPFVSPLLQLVVQPAVLVSPSAETYTLATPFLIMQLKETGVHSLSALKRRAIVQHAVAVCLVHCNASVAERRAIVQHAAAVYLVHCNASVAKHTSLIRTSLSSIMPACSTEYVGKT